ncbi:uncharacterized protein [Atheta coriaria]|uniref:uncharacterized protein n=1 Tax=Dalotia coriaria TaxID=877792 RepID=UPI0031F3E16D
MFMSRPFHDKGTVLTLQWFAEEYYYYALSYQTVFALFLVALVMGFNGLFLLTITNMRAQFIILNWNIQNHKNNGSPNDMKALIGFVNHHRFLLSYVRDIEKVFMIQLLALYCLTIASCCMELYAITETPTTLTDKARSFIYVTSLLVQLSMFCFPAGELTSEIFLLSESLYLMNWEDGSRALQTWLPFALHATQRVVDFKAVGLITINKMAFVDVGKSTISFLTLMRNMNR